MRLAVAISLLLGVVWMLRGGMPETAAAHAGVTPHEREIDRLKAGYERAKSEYANARLKSDRAGAELIDALKEARAVPHQPAGSARPQVVRSYRKAKTVLHRDVYRDHRRTLYCDCPYDEDKKVQPEGCFSSRLNNRRSRRVEWEHIVPASYFGSQRTCWRVGHPSCDKRGRSCCEQPGVDPTYAAMSSDMHNLAPSIGEVNARRSNYLYGETTETDDYGLCDFDVINEVAEPADAVRGDIARAWLYMSATYSMPISPVQRDLFQAWNAADPPDAWEATRNTRIAAAQGNVNAFVVDDRARPVQ